MARKELTSGSTQAGLPSGWKMVRFGDVVWEYTNHERNPIEQGLERFVGLEHLDPHALKISRWGKISDGTTFTKRFDVGHVLFGKRRAYQRKAAVADFEGLCSSDILVFQANPDQLLPGLLPFLVHTDAFFNHALGTSSGSLSPRTKWRELAEFTFPLPPLERQWEMLELFQTFELALDENARAIKCAENLRFSLMNELLLNGLTGDRSKETSSEKPSEFWTIKEISELGYSDSPVVQTGPFGSILKPHEFTKSGTPVLNIGNVQYGYMVLDSLDYVSLEKAEKLNKYRVQIGDLLFSRMASVGRTAEVQQECDGWIMSYHLMRLRLNPQKFIPRLLMYFLIYSKEVVSQIEQESFGSTRSGINTSILEKIRIPCPSIDEQKKIVSVLSDIDESVNSLILHKKTLENLKTETVNSILSNSDTFSVKEILKDFYTQSSNLETVHA
jgi:type I restriction enzyme, S subunit